MIQRAEPYHPVTLLSGLVLMLMGAAAVAADIPFRDGTFHYDLDEKRLADFLEEFFEDQGIPVVLSAMVEAAPGRMVGPQTGSGEAIFRRIADSHRLIAFHDGFAAYLYMLSESQIRYLDIPPDRIARFQAAARELGLTGSGNELQVRVADGFAVARGTPRFVEQIEELARAFRTTGEEVSQTFQSFALRYAWASDTTVEVGNRIVTVPGVASLLRELLHGPTWGPMASGRGERVRRTTAARMRGLGLSDDPRLPLQVLEDRDMDHGWSERGQPMVPSGFGRSTTFADAHIVADPYRNAVIVRDRPENFEFYESLIRALDIEPAVIEIEAAIIDVDLRRMRQLGVDWRFRTTRNEVIFSTDDVKQNFVETIVGDNIDLIQQRPGLQIATIIGDSRSFLARIDLLESEGVTNVISRPQIITLNNAEAIIESTESLFVPVTGAFEVDLFNVNAGTVMRVTPHRIERDPEEGGDQLRLNITLEDGFVTVSEVGGAVVPLSRRTRVNTQALIGDGQSLLLGGLSQETAGVAEEGVPGLRRVPLLGRLFRRESQRREYVERLFLLTPRLVPLNEITGQRAPARIDTQIEDLQEISGPPLQSSR
ncbi:MAG: type III secretion system outer membrane ring subunit SctC [Wenzhouxiangella sp.]